MRRGQSQWFCCSIMVVVVRRGRLLFQKCPRRGRVVFNPPIPKKRRRLDFSIRVKDFVGTWL